ncbi:MAG: hypothetical protein ACK55Z_21100 [bacterium]
MCRRCGKRTFHIQKKTCASCGYPSAHLRSCKTFSSSACARVHNSSGLGNLRSTQGVERERGARGGVDDSVP